MYSEPIEMKVKMGNRERNPLPFRPYNERRQITSRSIKKRKKMNHKDDNNISKGVNN